MLTWVGSVCSALHVRLTELSQQLCEIRSITISIIWMRKTGLRKINLTQDHGANKSPNCDLNPDNLAPESAVHNYTLLPPH